MNRSEKRSCDKFQLTMPHDELWQSLPEEIRDRIENAGFVVVARVWRDMMLKYIEVRESDGR